MVVLLLVVAVDSDRKGLVHRRWTSGGCCLSHDLSVAVFVVEVMDVAELGGEDVALVVVVLVVVEDRNGLVHRWTIDGLSLAVLDDDDNESVEEDAMVVVASRESSVTDE